MKTIKTFTLAVLALVTSVNMTNAQTTATDFTANDCVGVPHNLFTELDAGKIIVIAWVMPCGSCAAPSLAAYNAVQSFASSNPNTVYFYLVDDVANTSCSSLTTWGNTNGMPTATKFSDATINMSDYGTPGMPKIVVLGGSNHTIAYNLNSGVTQSGVQNAISDLLASLSTSEITTESKGEAIVVPNPVNGDFTVEYQMVNVQLETIEIVNATGQVVYTTEHKAVGTGVQTVKFSAELKLEKGLYTVRISNPSEKQTTNFVVY